MQYELLMRFVGDDEDGHVEAVLTRNELDDILWAGDGDTYGEVIRQMFDELGRKVVRDDHTLTVTFKTD